MGASKKVNANIARDQWWLWFDGRSTASILFIWKEKWRYRWHSRTRIHRKMKQYCQHIDTYFMLNRIIKWLWEVFYFEKCCTVMLSVLWEVFYFEKCCTVMLSVSPNELTLHYQLSPMAKKFAVLEMTNAERWMLTIVVQPSKM